MNCLACGKELLTGDHGWYCSNQECRKYDEDIEAYEKYCEYCKKMTPHAMVDKRTDGRGTGGDLRCSVCGSARLSTIQGFDAALM